MHNVRRRKICILALVYSVLLFAIIFGYKKYIHLIHESNISIYNEVPNNFNIEKSNFIQENLIQNVSWNISIPKLNLNNIPISEGVESNVLNEYVGHFPSSSYITGNVCLAAHNAGYPNNYFQDLYKLEVGDEIIYSYKGYKRIYIVEEKIVISEKDFSFLKLEDYDCISLITCVSGSPLERLCIKAYYKEE